MVAALLILSRLRPDPREIGRELGRLDATAAGAAADAARPLGQILRQPRARMAVTS